MPTLSTEQDAAYKAVVDWWRHGSSRVFYLCGYAGSGKSTLLPYIVDGLNLTPIHPDQLPDKSSRISLVQQAHNGDRLVLFAAPTGQAALVMSRKFRAAGFDWQAMTLHKALYTPVDKTLHDYLMEVLLRHKSKQDAQIYFQFITNGDDSALTPQQKSEKTHWLGQAKSLQSRDTMRARFQLQESSIAECASLIVVDEASMVSGGIVRDLLSSGARILAVGDPAQLPPIKSSTALISNATLPDAMLSEIHRQAQDNPIIQLASAVRLGTTLPPEGYISPNREIIIHPQRSISIHEIAASRTTTDATKEATLVGTNQSRWAITHYYRSNNYGPIYVDPQVGEPLICVRNNYYKGSLMMVNGQQLVVCRPSKQTGSSVTYIEADVVADPRRVRMAALSRILKEYTNNSFSSSPQDEHKSLYHIDFAYAMTVHKFQGSQATRIIAIDESQTFRHDARRWLYTLVTRAEKAIEIFQP